MAFVLLPAETACAQRAARPDGHDLTQLKVVGNVLSKVRTRYVEPRRIHPRRMLRSALERIQRSVPEVILRFKGKDRVDVQVNTKSRTFPLDVVDSPWALSTALRGIFKFIQPNLHDATKRRDVEYAAVDGILKTLDCHSVLLRPEFFGEMQIHTRGSFGGLGITISRCGHPQMLTVVKPIPGTPAHKAGLRAGDQIVRIGREPTANLTLSEAVKRLRGKPGSKVTIWVRRNGGSPRSYTIERARIHIKAVDHRMLENGVGYIRIKNFQSTTDWELRFALQALSREGMKSLVLDLRGNGGGLLSKAIKVADAFLYSGTIVTTVEHGVKRHENRANWSRTLAGRTPLAVLVDGGTASASEIVAGALKNLDRAVVIGQRTYGKGSVQVIYPNRDKSGFKVTIAQYLTPGDRSIQGIGVIPDIELYPVAVKKDRVTYFSSGADLVREGDRACSLRRASLALRTPPERKIYHLESKTPRGFRCEPCGAPPDYEAPPDPDQFHLDYGIRLASKVLQRAPATSRRRMLATARDLLVEQQSLQEKRIADRLGKVAGVDWSAPPKGSPAPKLTARVQVGKGGTIEAGEAVDVAVTVSNAAGAGAAYRVRGLIYSTHPALQHREVFMGKVPPGQKRTSRIQVKLPKGVRARGDDLAVRFHTAVGEAPEPSCTVFRIRPRPKPEFAFTRQFMDDLEGSNGDGRLQPGEKVRLRVQVKNVGKGVAGETYLRLKSLSGDAITVQRGVFALSGLRPGKSRVVDLEFEALAKLPLPKVKLNLSIKDCELGSSTKETLVFPVASPGASPAEARGVAAPVKPRIPLYMSPRLKDVVAWSKPGARFSVEATLSGEGKDVLRVKLGKRSSAFLRAADVKRLPRGRARPRLDWRWLPAPPEITLADVADVTRNATISIRGKVKDREHLADVYVSVRRLLRTPDRSRIIGVDYNKVYYRATQSPEARELSFKTEVPLWKGSNLVTVTARKNDQVTSKRVFRVLRTTCKAGVPDRLPGATVPAARGPGSPRSPGAPRSPGSH